MLLRPNNTIQLTLCILKPHICAVPSVRHDVQRMIVKSGFYLIRTKQTPISKSQATEFYKEHIGKFFFNRLVTFMSSGSCVFHILAKENAIEDWRNLLGPTKVYKTVFSHPHSIRGTHGLSDTRNAAHGSDSMESADREIKVFFPDFDSVSWLSRWSEKVARGQLFWNQGQFIHDPR